MTAEARISNLANPDGYPQTVIASGNEVALDSRRLGLDDVGALIVGAVAGIAGAMALFQAMQSGQLDLAGFAAQAGNTLTQEAQTMGIPLAEASPAYWYVARAGGILAYLLLWIAVFWGITMSSKMAKGVVQAKLIFGLHEFLPFLALIFAALHVVVLLGDSYIQFRIWHLLLPFTSPYEPLWTGLGILAFYLMIALVVSFYVRNRIGSKRWRSFHYVAYIAYLLALVHGVQVGTDSGRVAMQWVYVGTATLILFATWYRILTAKGRRNQRRRTTAS